MKYILLSDSDPDIAYYCYFTIIMHEYQSSSKKTAYYSECCIISKFNCKLFVNICGFLSRFLKFGGI